MIRFTLSRFWAQAALAAGLLMAIAVALGVTGVHLYHLWDVILGPCLAAHPAIARLGPGPGGTQCQDAFHGLATAYAPYGWLRDAAGVAVLIVPGLIGVFWGAPLVAPELHDGTWRLAWTQSVTRTRWLAVQLAVAGAASVAVAGLLSLLVTWWSGPLDRLAALDGAETFGRFNLLLFGERGIVPMGYAAFGFMLGVTAGVVLRRTVPAMAVALAGLAGARLTFSNWVRPHLVPPVHLSLPIMPFTRSILFDFGSGAGPGPLQAPGRAARPAALAARTQPATDHGVHYWAAVGRLPNIPGAWVYSDQLADSAGHAPSSQFLAHTACIPRALSGPAGHTCLTQLAARYHQVLTVQPASRYWLFQAYEMAIFTAAALLLAVACLWWIRRRLT